MEHYLEKGEMLATALSTIEDLLSWIGRNGEGEGEMAIDAPLNMASGRVPTNALKDGQTRNLAEYFQYSCGRCGHEVGDSTIVRAHQHASGAKKTKIVKC